MLCCALATPLDTEITSRKRGGSSGVDNSRNGSPPGYGQYISSEPTLDASDLRVQPVWNWGTNRTDSGWVSSTPRPARASLEPPCSQKEGLPPAPPEDYRTRFYETYRQEAEDYDREFTKKHDEDLNTTLIFVSLGFVKLARANLDDRLGCSPPSPPPSSSRLTPSSNLTQTKRRPPSVSSSTRWTTPLSATTFLPSHGGLAPNAR